MTIVKQQSPEGTLYNGYTVQQWRALLVDTTLKEEDVRFFVEQYENEESLYFIISELQKKQVREILILGLIIKIFDLGLIDAREIYRKYGGLLF